MEISIKANEPRRMEIEFQDTDLTLPDLIAAELLKSGDVEFAGVSKDHPEIGKPLLVVVTKRKKAAEDLEAALEQLEESFSELRLKLQSKKR